MATNIAIDVYEFSTGMDFARKYTQPFIVQNIVSVDQASVYNFQRRQFTDVRSKITADAAGVIKEYFVAQTVAQVKTLMDA